MDLNDNEKKLLIRLLERYLREVKGNEKLTDQSIAMLAAEGKLEEFLERVIEKLK